MIQFREAGISDIPLIRELAHATWKTTYPDILPEEQMNYMLEMMYSTSSLNHQINQQKHRFLFAMDDGRPVAFASWSEMAIKGSYRLHKIYVSATRQGKGIGKKLIERIIQTIQPEGSAVLELNVNRHNKAKDFYLRQGFRIVREEDIDIGNGYFMNDYVMQKTISGVF